MTPLKKTITKENENILIDGSVFNASDIEIVDLSFQKLARSIKVNFTLKIKEGEKTLLINTTISQRNNL